MEEKAPGHFTRGLREKTSDERGFGTDRMIFKAGEPACVARVLLLISDLDNCTFVPWGVPLPGKVCFPGVKLVPRGR